MGALNAHFLLFAELEVQVNASQDRVRSTCEPSQDLRLVLDDFALGRSTVRIRSSPREPMIRSRSREAGFGGRSYRCPVLGSPPPVGSLSPLRRTQPAQATWGMATGETGFSDVIFDLVLVQYHALKAGHN
jgi:hypothetical protein